MLDHTYEAIFPPPYYTNSTDEVVPPYTTTLTDDCLSSSISLADAFAAYQLQCANRLHSLSFFKVSQPLNLFEARECTIPTYQLSDSKKNFILAIRFEETKTVYLDNKNNLICQGEKIYPTYTKDIFRLKLSLANLPHQFFNITMVNIDEFSVTIDPITARRHFLIFDGDACKIIRERNYKKVACFKVKRAGSKLGSLVFFNDITKSDMLILTLAFIYIKRTLHSLKPSKNTNTIWSNNFLGNFKDLLS